MTSPDGTILEVEQHDGLLQLRLNRPDSANALSPDLLAKACRSYFLPS